MKNEIMKFDFNGNQVNVIRKDGDESWWVAKDVCEVLEIRTDTVNAILDEDEFSNTNTIGIKIDGVNRGLTIINEPGLYSLVLRSRKPEAKVFKRWVTHEVLPAIRKTGGYLACEETDDPGVIMARALLVAQSTIDEHKARFERERAKVEEANKTIFQLKPDADYTKEVLAAKNLHTVNSIGVHLGISAIKLNKFLEDERMIYRSGKTIYPSHKIRDKGYCDYQVVPYFDSNGDPQTREHLKWTESGRRFVIDLWEKRHGVRTHNFKRVFATA